MLLAEVSLAEAMRYSTEPLQPLCRNHRRLSLFIIDFSNTCFLLQLSVYFEYL